MYSHARTVLTEQNHEFTGKASSLFWTSWNSSVLSCCGNTRGCLSCTHARLLTVDFFDNCADFQQQQQQQQLTAAQQGWSHSLHHLLGMHTHARTHADELEPIKGYLDTRRLTNRQILLGNLLKIESKKEKSPQAVLIDVLEESCWLWCQKHSRQGAGQPLGSQITGHLQGLGNLVTWGL